MDTRTFSDKEEIHLEAVVFLVVAVAIVSNFISIDFIQFTIEIEKCNVMQATSQSFKQSVVWYWISTSYHEIYLIDKY